MCIRDRTVSAYAAGMGGSQVYLKEGEQMSVSELLKCITVVSGNDAAVAMAEYLSGSEAAFVAEMNLRARELGMADTNFVNCTGLPAQGHLTSAHDIALMSRELILNHPSIREYTTIWMDSIREVPSVSQTPTVWSASIREPPASRPVPPIPPCTASPPPPSGTAWNSSPW